MKRLVLFLVLSISSLSFLSCGKETPTNNDTNNNTDKFSSYYIIGGKKYSILSVICAHDSSRFSVNALDHFYITDYTGYYISFFKVTSPAPGNYDIAKTDLMKVDVDIYNERFVGWSGSVLVESINGKLRFSCKDIIVVKEDDPTTVAVVSCALQCQ